MWFTRVNSISATEKRYIYNDYADTSVMNRCCGFFLNFYPVFKSTADWDFGQVRHFLTTLRPAAVPLMSRNARRNSPAFPGSMLSWRRRDSSPAPGRQSGRIPEWHTDTFTDIKTVLQADCEASWPRWDDDWAGGGVLVHPPELSDMPLPTDGIYRVDTPVPAGFCSLIWC